LPSKAIGDCKTLCDSLAALRENMEIQNKNDELTKELLQSRREVTEKTQLQRTIERFVDEKLLCDLKLKLDLRQHAKTAVEHRR
jgi:hypothetical protein